MEIQNNNTFKPLFKGYDARPLKGVFLRYTNAIPKNFEKIVVQLEQIGNQHGFDVFIQGNDEIVYRNIQSLPTLSSPIRGDSIYVWPQDNITFLPNNMVLQNNKIVNKFNMAVSKFFGVETKPTKRHISGGNYFIVDKDGRRELLLGRANINDMIQLSKDLNVDSVRMISQADFHIDLFIRPLKDKVVLLTDDTYWLARVKDVIKKIETDESLSSNPKFRKVCNKLKEVGILINTMNLRIPGSPYKPLKDVEKELVDAGYKVVKVPGRIFDYTNSYDGILPNHFLNYMNAIVHENSQGELVYITNKSNLNRYCGITEQVAKRLDFDFTTEFVNSVKDYIKPENIYFVNSKWFLKDYWGGIHCLSSEIPKF